MGAGDFFVAPANQAAHDMILTPDLWPRGKLCVTGPEGAGKSHLARVFAARTDARITEAAQITPETPRPVTPTVIENAEQLPPAAQEWLFHLHNALQGRAPLLLTARSEPARWPLTLPDLASRMQGTAVVRIDPPDEALLMAVMMKLFADRQIAPDPGLPPFLLARIDRSFAAVGDIVDRLDRAALTHSRRINARLASDVLSGTLSP